MCCYKKSLSRWEYELGDERSFSFHVVLGVKVVTSHKQIYKFNTVYDE